MSGRGGILVDMKPIPVPAIMEQETRYFALLAEARRLERDGATLLIHCDGSEPLRFARVED